MWNIYCNRLAVVLLMVFAIGYSSIAIASAQSMHLTITSSHTLTHHSASNTCSNIQSHAVEPMPNVIHDTHQQVHTSTHPQHTTDCQSSTHTDDCIDCQLNLCQNVFSWLASLSPQLADQLSIEPAITLALPYQAQNLTGYWQVLLRPPQK
jgi:hypothetical protein